MTQKWLLGRKELIASWSLWVSLRRPQGLLFLVSFESDTWSLLSGPVAALCFQNPNFSTVAGSDSPKGFPTALCNYSSMNEISGFQDDMIFKWQVQSPLLGWPDLRESQGFPNMPFVKCLPGFAEVPYQVPPWSLPVAPRMPKNRPKEAYLVPAAKARLYPKVLIAKCLPGGAEGPYQGQPLSPRKCFKNVLSTRLEGTFGCKARLENAENRFADSRQRVPELNPLFL